MKLQTVVLLENGIYLINERTEILVTEQFDSISGECSEVVHTISLRSFHPH